MSKYQLLCMSFDGDFQRERPEFETIQEVWEYSNDIGSRWFFYPFHFVVKGKTIKSVPDFMEMFLNRRIKTVQEIFKTLSEQPDMEGANCDDFIFALQEPF